MGDAPSVVVDVPCEGEIHTVRVVAGRAVGLHGDGAEAVLAALGDLDHPCLRLARTFNDPRCPVDIRLLATLCDPRMLGPQAQEDLRSAAETRAAPPLFGINAPTGGPRMLELLSMPDTLQRLWFEGLCARAVGGDPSTQVHRPNLGVLAARAAERGVPFPRI